MWPKKMVAMVMLWSLSNAMALEHRPLGELTALQLPWQTSQSWSLNTFNVPSFLAGLTAPSSIISIKKARLYAEFVRMECQSRGRHHLCGHGLGCEQFIAWCASGPNK